MESKEELIKRLKEISKMEVPGFEERDHGAMCYSPAPPPMQKYTCERCHRTFRFYGFDSLDYLVEEMQYMGIDAVLETVCSNGCPPKESTREEAKNPSSLCEKESIWKRFIEKFSGDSHKTEIIEEPTAKQEPTKKERTPKYIYPRFTPGPSCVLDTEYQEGETDEMEQDLEERNPQYNFSVRFSPTEAYHKTENVSYSELTILLNFFEKKYQYRGDYGEDEFLKEHLDTIQKLTGLSL